MQSDLTPAEHESTGAIDLGVAWLIETPRQQRGNAFPELQRRFGLTAVQACAALREYNLRLARAA